MTSDDPRWGETRTRDRGWRRKRRAGTILAAALGAIVGVPGVLGLTRVPLERHLGVSVVSATLVIVPILLAIVIAVAFVWSWRDSDEVQRRLTANAWATVGAVGFVGHPLAHMLEHALALPPLSEPLWWTSLGAGLAVYLYQRVRG